MYSKKVCKPGFQSPIEYIMRTLASLVEKENDEISLLFWSCFMLKM